MSPKMEKQGPPYREKGPYDRGGEKGPLDRNVYFFQGWRTHTLASLCERPWTKVIIQCTTFSEIFHHIIISKHILECNQLNYFFKIFSEKHNLEFSSNEIEQRYTHSTIDNDNTSLLCLKYYTSMFEHGFLPLIKDHSFKDPSPSKTIGYVTNNAMLAFPQEKISHYTTDSNYLF